MAVETRVRFSVESARFFLFFCGCCGWFCFCGFCGWVFGGWCGCFGGGCFFGGCCGFFFWWVLCGCFFLIVFLFFSSPWTSDSPSRFLLLFSLFPVAACRQISLGQRPGFKPFTIAFRHLLIHVAAHTPNTPYTYPYTLKVSNKSISKSLRAPEPHTCIGRNVAHLTPTSVLCVAETPRWRGSAWATAAGCTDAAPNRDSAAGCADAV